MIRTLIFANARKLLRNESGNIAIMFGAASIPLLLIMGGAVDFTRHNRYKVDLANAVDAGALALARNAETFSEECKKVGETCPQAGKFVSDYIAAMFTPHKDFKLGTVSVARSTNGFSISASGDMHASFLPLGRLIGGKGQDTLAVDVRAGVARDMSRLELALVFDNTGSMALTDTGSGSRMDGLKFAANALLDELMPEGSKATDDLKIAVVPFEGTVNILNDSFKWDWIDKGQYEEWSVTTGKNKKTETTTYRQWYGRSKYNGINVESIRDKANKKRQPSHFWLYELLKVKWAGCVEMRQEYRDAQTGVTTPYDILDVPPDQNKPETLFVQSFWPDEPDRPDSESVQSHNHYTNNYLEDDVDGEDDDGDEDNDTFPARQAQFSKYQKNHSWRTDAEFPYASGPNHGCPRPIVPLTSSRTTVKGTIDAMEPFGAMGTFIPNGLVWGWHVLSAGEPFTEGVQRGSKNYGKTIKAVVLLSDGENSATVTSDKDNHNKSLYSGYNYYSAGRLGTSPDNTASDGPNAKLNGKTAALCSNVKGDNIRVYTITFGAIPESTKSLMRDCASTSDNEKLFFHAPSNDALAAVFKEIGADLKNLHLSM